MPVVTGMIALSAASLAVFSVARSVAVSSALRMAYLLLLLALVSLVAPSALALVGLS